VANVAKGFEEKWDFVNCGVTVDGKHVRVLSPRNTGAKFFNYEGFYSLVLIALVDSNFEFLYVDVGKNGRISDGGVIEETTFYRKLNEESLNIPNNNETKKNLNFVFLGDEAFACSNRIHRLIWITQSAYSSIGCHEHET